MAGAAFSEHVELSEQAGDLRDVHRTVLLLGKSGSGKSTLANRILGTHGHVKRTDQAASLSNVQGTILLLGKTGNGKSTLGNVIVGTHLQEKSEEVFKEGEFGASETVDAKGFVVDIAGKKYRIVDTIGISDTNIQEEDVLRELARTCHYLREGISQIFFVTSGRLTKEEREFYDVLRHLLFSDEMGRYVTVVRTRSLYFENRKKCDEDIQQVKENSPHARDILERASMIIHVNNPNKDDALDWVQLREKSRSRLLARLEMCGEVYKPPNLLRINRNITVHIEKEQRLEKEIESLRKDMGKEDSALRQEMDKPKTVIPALGKKGADREKLIAQHDADTKNSENKPKKYGDAQAMSIQDLEQEYEKAKLETLVSMIRAMETNLKNVVDKLDQVTVESSGEDVGDDVKSVNGLVSLLTKSLEKMEEVQARADERVHTLEIDKAYQQGRYEEYVKRSEAIITNLQTANTQLQGDLYDERQANRRGKDIIKSIMARGFLDRILNRKVA